MELDKDLEMYVNDLETQEIFGKWAEKIAEDKGIELGKEQGIELGKEQGYELGAEEKTLNIARQMLAKNLDLKLICECTGLSLKEIKSLKY